MRECLNCGQKLRPQWVRCPRCRQRVSGPGNAASDRRVEPASPERAGRGWQFAVGAIAIVAVGAGASMIGNSAGARPSTPLSQTQSAQRAANARTDAEIVDSPQGADAVAPKTSSTNFEAIDSRRSAAAAYSAGNLAEALAASEAAVAAAPSDPEARNNLGQLLVRHGRAREALPHFDEAVRLDGSRWSYRFNRARAYGLVERWPEAISEYRAALQQFPDDHATLYNLGLALLKVRDYPGAATTLEQAVTAAPEQQDFLITLGTAYVGASRPDRARVTFERFLQIAPNDPEVPKVKALLQALAESAQ